MYQNSKVSNTTIQQATNPFPVVAIGASAGAFEALSELLAHLPPGLGLSWIVIQHSGPIHESIQPVMLESVTNMQVHKGEDGVQILPDHLYVIPPYTFISIIDKKLKISADIKSDDSYYGLDFFMVSLAGTCQDLAIGVLLTGIGTDGTEGIRHIKAEGGITFAQENVAHFQEMLRNALVNGFADFILSPEEIAKKIVEIVKRDSSTNTLKEQKSANDAGLKLIHHILNSKKFVDFSFNKQMAIRRRIWRRMRLKGQSSTDEYAGLIQHDPIELDLLYSDLLINASLFLKEPEVYQVLSETIFPALLKNRIAGDVIRIWCPACGTGEEATSVMICLYKYLTESGISISVQLFGTDIDEKAIEKARAGYYSHASLQNVPPEWLKRFFKKVHDGYQIIKDIRDMCIFGTHNLQKDSPFSNMDIISCQNGLIDMESESQKKMLQSFHYSLKPSGYLVLGKSESIGHAAVDLFALLINNVKIYVKKPYKLHRREIDFLKKTVLSPKPQPLPLSKERVNTYPEIFDIDRQTEKLLLSTFVPASVVIDSNFNVVRVYGLVEKYLQPSSGKASQYLPKLLQNALVYELQSLIAQVKKENRSICTKGFSFMLNGQYTEIDIEVLPVQENVKEPSYLIVFQEKTAVAKPPTNNHAILHEPGDDKNKPQLLKNETRNAKLQIKNMMREFDATPVQLEFGSKEIISKKAELQSISKKLESSKEELQSVNEELTAINKGLLLRNADMKEAIAYSVAIVETIREPLILLDAKLRIHTVNKAFYQVFKLAPEYVEDYFLYEIDNRRWNVPELLANLSEVYRTKKGFTIFELSGIFTNRVLLFNAMPLRVDNKKGDRILLRIQDITEQRQAQQAKEWLSAVVDASGEGIFSFSTTRVVISWNKGSEEIFGYTAKEMIGRSVTKLWPSDVRISHLKQVEQVLNGETLRQHETTWVHKDGHLIPVSLSISPIKNGGNEIQGLMASVQDITKRKLAEIALQESEERFRSIVSQTAVGIGRSDFDGRVLFANQKLCDLMNTTMPELMKQSIWDFTDKEDLEKTKEIYRQLQQDGIPIQYEKRLIRKDGTRFWVKVSLSCIRDTGGKPQYALSVVLDISKRKDAEVDLQKTKESLQVALEAANMGIWEMDISNNMTATFHSTKHDQIYGYTDWQPIWTHETAMLHILDEDKHLFNQAFEKMLQSGEGLQIELRVRWDDGTIHWMYKLGRLFYDAAGIPVRAAGIVMDITERKKLERQKEECIVIASHQLKTPLTTIKAYAQILQTHFLEEQNKVPVEMLGKIDKQADRLVYLINELLDVTRITEGHLQLYPETFDMNDLIKELAEEMQPTLLQHQIVLKLLPLQMLMADKERIRQVIRNLISNAVKYSPDADAVIVHTENNSENVTVTVEDFGIGMTDAELSKLFDFANRTFTRLNSTFPRTGLGVYISAEIIKIHKGTMHVENKKNLGTVFKFSLPLNI